ncbi:MAG TPA: dephospho-CoA kinase [Microbacteriaceae bacterium]|nr:dephospho-CoA kinase [Microbacteriaceae bacterium]
MLIALTGGIASGKSTIAAQLAKHGAVIVDADQIAREAVAPGTPGLNRIAEVFGADVLLADGSLNRAALGSRVFGDDVARRRLEEIVHPEVRRLSRARFDAAFRANPDAVVVYDVPLLVEAARDEPFDLVVVAIAGREAQLARLTGIRGLAADEAAARLAAQATDDERRAIADVVIDTSGSLDETIAAVDRLWADRIAPVR